jgi:hypothetical protein
MALTFGEIIQENRKEFQTNSKKHLCSSFLDISNVNISKDGTNKQD